MIISIKIGDRYNGGVVTNIRQRAGKVWLSLEYRAKDDEGILLKREAEYIPPPVPVYQTDEEPMLSEPLEPIRQRGRKPKGESA